MASSDTTHTSTETQAEIATQTEATGSPTEGTQATSSPTPAQTPRRRARDQRRPTETTPGATPATEPAETGTSPVVLRRLATQLSRLTPAERDTVLAPYLARAGAGSASPTRPCLCGCGGTTKSRFVPGHDARLKGTLQQAYRAEGGLSPEQVVLVRDLGWEHLVCKPAPEKKAKTDTAQLATAANNGVVRN